MRRCVDGAMTTVDPLSVDVHLDSDDLRVLATLTSADPKRSDARRLYWPLRATMWAALVNASIVHPVVWIVTALEVGVLALEQQWRRRARQSRAYEVLNGRYAVAERGLSKTSSIGETLIAWKAIEALSQTGDRVCIRFFGTGWVVPFRCFSSDEHRGEFVAALRRQIDDASGDRTG
jgi:hypothetical protein